MPFNAGRLPFHIVRDPAGKGDDTVLWEPTQLAWLGAVTLLFALIAVAYIRFDGNRILRAFRLTERTTRDSIWNDILESEVIDNQPVQVELGDGRNVLGVLLYYSDASEDGSLYLRQASWVDPNGHLVPIPGPGILLTKSSGIRSVSLLDPPEDLPNETADQPPE
jgi:hypothetical protein